MPSHSGSYDAFRLATKSLFRETIAPDIRKCLQISGSRLKNVTQVDLNGTEAFAMLFSDNNEPDDPAELQGHGKRSWRYYLERQALLWAWKHLQNVEVVAVGVNEAYHDNCRSLLDDPPTQARLLRRFPKLQQVICKKVDGDDVIWTRPDEIPKDVPDVEFDRVMICAEVEGFL